MIDSRRNRAENSGLEKCDERNEWYSNRLVVSLSSKQFIFNLKTTN